MKAQSVGSRFLMMLVAGLLFTGMARADSVTFGLPSYPGGSCIPFGCLQSFGATNFQQVYSASGFTGPALITSLTFFQSIEPGGSITNATYSFSLSTTSVAVGGLDNTFAGDTTNLSNNIGANNQAFFSGVLIVPPSGTLTITGTPFAYDPSQGNLLMNIVITGSGPDGNVNFDVYANFYPVCCVPYNISATTNAPAGTPGGNNIGALTTQIDFTPVPEPSTLVLLCTGVTVIWLKRWRGL